MSEVNKVSGTPVLPTQVDVNPPFTCCEYTQRIALFAAAVFFTCGLALLSSRVQDLWKEIKAGRKIIYLSKEEVEAKPDTAKTDTQGQEVLVEKKDNPSETTEPEQITTPVATEPPNTEITTPAEPSKKNHLSTDRILGLKATLKDLAILKPHFENIHSNKTIDLTKFIPNPDMGWELKEIVTREDFNKAAKWTEGDLKFEPVLIMQSDFVPLDFTEHLMRRKQDSKLGQKMSPGDYITNMDGALHTFLTPITPIIMSGDYAYNDGHTIVSLNGRGRKVVLSAAIQPDFEKGGKDSVILKIVEIQKEEVKGEPNPDLIPFYDTKMDPSCMVDLESLLQRHMVYHLTEDHCLPSQTEIAPEKIKDVESAIKIIEELIKQEPSTTIVLKDIDGKSAFKIIEEQLQNLQVPKTISLKGEYVVLNNHVISLEALLNLYVYQIRNEFTALEALLPQGYVYTNNPPSIFAAEIDKKNVKVLNRLQLLALKMHHQKSPLNNLKVVGFDDFADKEIVGLYKTVFADKRVCSKNELFSDKGRYSVEDDYALVIHNNSDAFGQNIETEGPTSLDGVIGSYSSASANLNRDRHDLTSNLFVVKGNGR